MWILRGSEALEIHTCFSKCMLFIADLQWIAKTKVKSGRGPVCASCRYAIQAATPGAYCRKAIYRESARDSGKSLALPPYKGYLFDNPDIYRPMYFLR